MSSEYLRVLLFLQAILIPACESPSPAFSMIYSAHKLNKQGYNIQHQCTPFPILNHSVVPHPVLTVASCPVYRLLRKTDKVVWYSHLLNNFPQFVVINTVKGFHVLNEAEVDVFLEFPCLVYDSADVGNLIPGSFFFSKSSLYIWKFLVHMLLKPSLRDFKHDLASMWNECNCVVVWAFFGIAFLRDWNENWPFPVLWPLPGFPNLSKFGRYFQISSFRIWNCLSGIPSLLALCS